MRSLVLFLLTGFLAVLPASAVIVPSEHLGAIPILLGLDRVREELKVDSLQRAVLDSIRSEYKSAVRKLTDPMPNTPEKRVAAEKELVAINERYNERALSVLNAPQRKRLIEIEHQVLGASMLYSPKVQKTLGLSAAQREQLATALAQEKSLAAKLNRQFEDGKIGYRERLELLRSRRLAQGVDLMSLLTPEQRDAFLALGGESFSF